MSGQAAEPILTATKQPASASSGIVSQFGMKYAEQEDI